MAQRQPSTPPQPPAFEVRPHPTKGRALHAAAAFPPGAAVHVFAAPALLIPSLPHLALVCAHCLRPGNPRACTRCRAAYYCDAACQAGAWAAGHARECKALRRRQGEPQPQSASQSQSQSQSSKSQQKQKQKQTPGASSRSNDDDSNDTLDDAPSSSSASASSSSGGAARRRPSAGEKVAGRSGAELPTPARALVQALLREDLADALDGLEGHAARRREQSGAAEWREMEIMAMAACAFAGKPVNEKEVRRAVDLLCKVSLCGPSRGGMI